MALVGFKQQFRAGVIKGLYPNPHQWHDFLHGQFIQYQNKGGEENFQQWCQAFHGLWQLSAIPKNQTIRKMRKNPFKHGETLYFYSGLRTKNTLKLGEAKAKRVSHIFMTNHAMIVEVTIDGKYLQTWEIQNIAIADGFGTLEAFRDFFVPDHDDEFNGQLIRW
ncbi:MAG: hypothetical protein AAF587_29500 [Bacteroidota bacterium]